jgi:hypothetical protein
MQISTHRVMSSTKSTKHYPTMCVGALIMSPETFSPVFVRAVYKYDEGVPPMDWVGHSMQVIRKQK